MTYYVLGEEVEIKLMQKPAGGHGSVFEFSGSRSLEKIGLKETFYFQMPNKFSFKLPLPGHDFSMKHADTHYLSVLSIFLGKCIWNRKLVNQYATPWL